jgi:hypothetical protein
MSNGCRDGYNDATARSGLHLIFSREQVHEIVDNFMQLWGRTFVSVYKMHTYNDDCIRV